MNWSAVLLESHGEFASAADKNTNRSVHIFRGRENQRARHDAGAARERFIFHAAFVGANGNAPPAFLFQEVRVCTFRRK